MSWALPHRRKAHALLGLALHRPGPQTTIDRLPYKTPRAPGWADTPSAGRHQFSHTRLGFSGAVMHLPYHLPNYCVAPLHAPDGKLLKYHNQ